MCEDSWIKGVGLRGTDRGVNETLPASRRDACELDSLDISFIS